MEVSDLYKDKRFDIFDRVLLYLKSIYSGIEINSWIEFSELLERAITLSGYDDTENKTKLLKMLYEIKELGESELNDEDAFKKYTNIIDGYRLAIVHMCSYIFINYIGKDPVLRAEFMRNNL